MTILGARPQFIKAAALSRAIKEHTNIQEIIVHTGQHYDANMSDIFFKEMNIPTPNYNLDINGLAQGAMTGQMIEKLEILMMQDNPHIVLLYGDTNSTLAGALSARKLNISIIHIEGGLRNFDLTIPEDVNRILTDRISDVIFYSTDSAKRNLDNEGFEHFPVKLIRTGDLMADVVAYYSQLAQNESKIISKLRLEQKKYMLCTMHRHSNLTNKSNITQICDFLNDIAKDEIIVFPAHPNTKKYLKEYNIHLSPNIRIIEPIGYFDMLELLRNSSFVITDSGGLQREAYLMQKKSLLLMEYTPWEELVDNTFSMTTKINHTEIKTNFEIIRAAVPDFNINLYGDGKTAENIITKIIELYGNKHV